MWFHSSRAISAALKVPNWMCAIRFLPQASLETVAFGRKATYAASASDDIDEPGASLCLGGTRGKIGE